MLASPLSTSMVAHWREAPYGRKRSNPSAVATSRRVGNSRSCMITILLFYNRLTRWSVAAPDRSGSSTSVAHCLALGNLAASTR
jgi:hypothetical protein